MCCFSGAVRAVANTNIFARLSGQGSQYLVYSMSVSAPAELAMILPLPVPQNTPETAVRFINLETYPKFFAELDSAFPVLRLARAAAAAPQSVPLKVVSVGSFEASFVPSLADFQRLDARFRLPQSVWQSLPQYQHCGFAIFKLLKRGDMSVHPMAFEFPTQHTERLFFPTLHIHDGKAHPSANYDHNLYCQIAEERSHLLSAWERSEGAASQYLNLAETQGIIDPAKLCYKVRIAGVYRNQDCWM